MSLTISYPLILLEMVRKNETLEDLEALLGLSCDDLHDRLTGAVEWNLSEIKRICEHFNKSFYDLF